MVKKQISRQLSIKLAADKAALAQKIDQLERQLRAEVDPDVDEADPGVGDQVVTLALLNNARQKADDLERAINQAQAGGYGICEDCQQSINPERLEIFPQTTLCVRCKGAREQVGSRWQVRAA